MGKVMLVRALLFIGVAAGAIPAVAAEVSSPSFSTANLHALVARHFEGGQPVTSQSEKLPRYRIADFDGDGKLDVVVPYTDHETLKRGSGCYGLGIVTSFKEQGSAKRAFQTYNCFGEYTVEVRDFIPIKVGGKDQRQELQSPRACVRVILKYGDRDFICHTYGRFTSIYSTPRAQSPPNSALQRTGRP